MYYIILENSKSATKLNVVIKVNAKQKHIFAGIPPPQPYMNEHMLMKHTHTDGIACPYTGIHQKSGN